MFRGILRHTVIFDKNGRHLGSHYGFLGPHHDSSQSPSIFGYSDMSLTTNAKKFCGPLMTTDTPSGTVLGDG